MDIQRISHYRIVRRLGAGGMGEVFLGEDTELERSVALKVMSPELAKDPNQRKRFRAEAKAASGILPSGEFSCEVSSLLPRNRQAG